MIAIDNERNATWQTSFISMLPAIEQKLRLAFYRLDLEAREEAMDEAIVHSLLAFVRLYKQGRADAATPSSLAWYSSRQIRRGRPAVGKMNGRDVLSRYAQIGNGIQIDRTQGQWIELLADDKKASVEEQVAARMDVTAWFATLTQRMRRIAKDLAFGFSTSEVAKKYGVTAGRISQLRRYFEESWLAFQGELVPAVV